MRVHAIFCFVLFIVLIFYFEGHFRVRESGNGFLFGPNRAGCLRVTMLDEHENSRKENPNGKPGCMNTIEY
jgi:hypothetical protein